LLGFATSARYGSAARRREGGFCATMGTPDDRIAFDQQVLRVYIMGLRSDIEAKLRELRDVEQMLAQLSEQQPSTVQIAALRGLASRFDRMLVANRVVRETLLQLRETATLLVQEIESGKPAKP
jgi:hypothetical protein